MEKDTVVLGIDEYNKLRDFYEKITDEEKVYKISIDSLSNELDQLNQKLLEKDQLIEKLYCMSSREFKKWKKNRFETKVKY